MGHLTSVFECDKAPVISTIFPLLTFRRAQTIVFWGCMVPKNNTNRVDVLYILHLTRWLPHQTQKKNYLLASSRHTRNLYDITSNPIFSRPNEDEQLSRVLVLCQKAR